jgi:tetratricopeptide (TPR) repeat protein
MGEKKRRLAAARQLSGSRFDERLIARAFQALRAGDRRAAETAFEGLLAAPPRDPEGLNAAGVLALQLGRAGPAAELLAGAVELDARQPTYRCHLAIACRRLGKPERAAEQLETALRLDPALAEAHSNLGLVLLDLGEHEAAARSFESALAIRTDFPDALNGRGMGKLKLGRYEDACADFERALALDPTRGRERSGRRPCRAPPMRFCLHPRPRPTRSLAWRASSRRSSSTARILRTGFNSKAPSAVSICAIPSIRACAKRCSRPCGIRRSTRRAWRGRSPASSPRIRPPWRFSASLRRPAASTSRPGRR